MDPKRLIADVTMPALEGPGPVVSAGSGTTVVEKLLSNIIGVLTIVAVVYFAIQIILAGYSFISAQGDEKQVASARKRLTDGVLGMTIVVVAMGLGALIATLLGIQNVFDLNAMFSKMGL